MNKEEILKETYYIKDKFYTNIQIEEEIKKYIKNIEIKVAKERDNEIYVYGKYKFANCRVRICKDYLYNDYNDYLIFISRDIKNVISDEFFLDSDSNE